MFSSGSPQECTGKEEVSSRSTRLLSGSTGSAGLASSGVSAGSAVSIFSAFSVVSNTSYRDIDNKNKTLKYFIKFYNCI